MRRGFVFALVLLALAAPAFAADPVVGVWYRGTPEGMPRQAELAVIRALGFGGITWPASHPQSVEALKAMCEVVGLQVTVAAEPAPVTPESLLKPADRVDLVVGKLDADALTAFAWRAIAHGARTLVFDSGSPTGAGLENADRSLKPWTRAAIDVARQFAANARFVTALRAGPGLIVTPDLLPALDVVMLDAGRSWVLIATNTSATPVAATVRLPAGAPYAIWLDLLDATTLAMNGEAVGPRWNLKMPAHSAHVYLIEKIMK